MSAASAQPSPRAPQTLDPSRAFEHLERLTGPIERVTFHSAESGFCVLQIHAKGQRNW